MTTMTTDNTQKTDREDERGAQRYPSSSRKAKRKGGKFFPALCNVIGTLLLLAVIASSLPLAIPRFMGYDIYNVVSGSMEPTIMTEDVIFVKKVPQVEIKEQDIISFRDGDSITTHRIVSIEEQNGIKKYKTKGDNNNVEDRELVSYENIEGKYQFKIDKFGNIIEILKSKLTLLILVFILAVNSWYSYRVSLRKQKRKEKREKYEENKDKIR